MWKMNITRPVELSKHHNGKMIPVGQGDFHGFGIDFFEFESGPGNYSTAIIELPDGTVKNVPVEHIRFLDRE